MIVAKSLGHLEEILRKQGVEYRRIIELESLFWVETKSGGVFQVPKPRKKEEVEEILRIGLFPQRFISEVLYGERKKTTALEKALRVKDRGIIQSGRAGVGKTYALVFKIALLVKNYELNSPLYLPIQSFNAQQYREIYQEYDGYLIDDLNTGLPEWKMDFFREVIYHAYNEDKRLFITTNVDTQAFFSVVKEEPIMSRLLESCEIQRIEDREDLRLKRHHFGG